MTRPSLFFYKMHGSGNDFILVDNREAHLSPTAMPVWARALCKRSFGVGADGFIVLGPAPEPAEVDYVWHFFNADGSRAEMCGNGSRCAARLAFELGLAPQDHVLGTDAGPIKARVLPDTGEVKVQLTPHFGMVLDKPLELGEHGLVTVHFVNTGVPHAVIVSDDVASVNVARLGPAVRFHDTFAPAGANANFIQIRDRGTMLLRTYERGVEAETYACGTGAAAAVVVAQKLGLCDRQVTVTTSGREELIVTLEDGSVYLQGKAVLVYKGEVFPDSVGLGDQLPATNGQGGKQ